MDKLPVIPKDLEYDSGETLRYFETAIDDGRIDLLIAKGEESTTFNFEGQSSFALDEALLPLNDQTDKGKQVTNYLASGQLSSGEGANFTLKLVTLVNNYRRDLTFQATEKGDFFMCDGNDPTFASEITLEEFGDITLLAANADPEQIRRSKQRNTNEQIVFQDNQTIFDYWVYMAQSRQGRSKSVGTYFSEPIPTPDNQTIEMRLTQVKEDLPQTQIETIILEHATQLTDLDAEIVYRLELYFESSGIDEQESIAEKRIVSGCDRSLVKSRLISQDKSGKITSLDINDSKIMDNFRIALEAMLQTI